MTVRQAARSGETAPNHALTNQRDKGRVAYVIGAALAKGEKSA